jgi:hypothetical protein
MKAIWRYTTHLFLCVSLLGTTWFPIAAAAQSAGWFKAGDHPQDYDMGIDRRAAFTGTSSGYIKNSKPDPQGFGTYMQMFNAADYRGTRIRLSAYMKAENVENWAGMWMRVDGDRKATAFDNMQDRPIKGTQEWTQYSVVLDVDSKATAIAFGILLAGKGTVWIDDVTFEIVGDGVPTTGALGAKARGPRNLDFEAGPER